MSPAPATLDAATHRAAMIARAERRRAGLEALAEAGMALAKEIAARFIDGPYHPELRHDPGRSHAAVARSVRLTFALETKMDEQILALIEGDMVPAEAPKSASARQPQPSVAHAPPAHEESTRSDEAPTVSEADREQLVESERPDLPDIPTKLRPPSPEVGRVDSPQASGVGKSGSSATPGSDPHSPTPDFAALRLDPPHVGGGRALKGSDPPPRE